MTLDGLPPVPPPDVARDLRAIESFVADYAGPAVAVRKLGEIERSFRLLSENPHVGSIRNEIHAGLRTIPTAHKGVIAFVVHDEAKAVFIVSVTYAGANWFATVANRVGP